jgi:hypothetical protein
MTPFSRIAATAALVTTAAHARAPLPSATAPDPVTRWSIAASTAAAAVGMPPLRTPLTFALLHVAMYDALVAVVEGHLPYAVSRPAGRPTSAPAAAIEAGYRVLLDEFPTQRPTIDEVHGTLLAEIPDGTAKVNGRAVGAAVARELLAIRATDGRNAAVHSTPGSGPAVWVPTPPGFLPATTSFLAHVTPFTMDNPSQFRPSGPTAMSARRWVDDYNEVKSLGAKSSATRSAEQTATGLFWEPLAGTFWPESIRRLAQEHHLDLSESARFQAAAFVAFADGLIACWDAKFYFNFWRPVTAIQNGNADGNDRTEPDPAWEPLSVTPNFPEYPSGHACATAAVTHVIEDFFPQGVLIPARNIVTGEERFYRKAADVVDEVVEARMLIGVHFRSSNEDGADIGRRIAQQIRSRWFKRRA